MIKKNNILFIFNVLLIIFFVYSCTLPQATSENKKKSKNKKDKNSSIMDEGFIEEGLTKGNPFKIGSKRIYLYDYPYGDKGDGKIITEYYLNKEYQSWKDTYVTNVGAGSNTYGNYLRVQRDFKTDYDTVSEGIGYGMLLAVYFDDQNTFDRLYLYARDHFNSHGLMHWRVNKSGKNITETFYNNKTIEVTKGSTIYATETSAYTGEILKDLSRRLTSVIDADLDMAASLVFAYYRWKTGKFGYEVLNYDTLAKNMLTTLRNIGISKFADDSRYLVQSGSLDDVPNDNDVFAWGNNGAWNPSYITPAWFKVFAHLEPAYAGFWSDVYNHSIDRLYQIYNVSGKSGLFPDWVNSRDNKIQQSTGSDRGKFSFNCYYDGVRVPWRMAVDYSWNGNQKEYEMLTSLATFVSRKYGNLSAGALTKVVDGYQMDGTAWSFNYADWNNVTTKNTGYTNARGEYIKDGGVENTATFVSMFATAFTATSSPSNMYAKYSVLAKKDSTTTFNYYGNTLRLLSLLYKSGYMADITHAVSYCHYAQGTVNGSPSGYYFIKSKYYSTYLAEDPAKIPGPWDQKYPEDGIILVDSRITDLNNNDYAKWQIIDNDNNGKCLIKNKGSGRYLIVEYTHNYFATDNNITEPGGCEGFGLFSILDNNSDYDYVIQTTKALRDHAGGFPLYLYANSQNQETLSTDVGDKKTWMLIKCP